MKVRSFGLYGVTAVALLASAASASADSTGDRRAALEAQLAQVQAQIAANQGNLADEQAQEKTLQGEMSVLSAQIKKAQLQIQERDLTISTLKDGITDANQGIGALNGKISDSQASLAQLIRNTRMIDGMSTAELALGGSLKDLFRDEDDFQSIQKQMDAAFQAIKAQKSDLSSREQALESQQSEQSDLLQLQVLQQKSLKGTQAQKQTLISQTKGQEAAYKQVIADQEKTAAQIQAQLFALNGSNKSENFGTMFGYAQEASGKTGVRPAVILAILTEESDLGQNVGTGNWKTDMNPTRDAPVFQQICSALGLDPDEQPVSKKPWYGWGGAMGPAQFIPSTWVQYQDRIAAMTGQTNPNPWDPRTATFATAILMMDNGADAQTPDAERLAALRYLAGWKNASKPAYAFYGDDVMGFADKYQSEIDQLSGS